MRHLCDRALPGIALLLAALFEGLNLGPDQIAGGALGLPGNFFVLRLRQPAAPTIA